MKKCTGRCGKKLSLSEFGWQSKKKNRRHPRCKKCRNADARDRNFNPERAERKAEKTKLLAGGKQRCSGRCGEVKDLCEFGYMIHRGRNKLKSRCRECLSRDSVDYNKRNPDKRKPITQKYKLKKRSDPVWLANKNRELRERLVSDPEYAERRREQGRRFRDTPKGRISSKVNKARRRARKLEQLCLCCNPDEREQAFVAGWLDQDCYICADCASETDHVIPLAAGKPGDELHCIDNFQSICKPCNASKNARHYPGSEGWEDFVEGKRQMNS